MKALIQRVSSADVSVDGESVGSIGHGLCVFVGVTHEDTEVQAKKLAERLWKLRIFSDDEGKMNRSVDDVGGALLVVSQFTLYGDTRKGNRPSYVSAARPAVAEPLFQRVVDHLRHIGAEVATGRFGADMAVELTNDGPVTVALEL